MEHVFLTCLALWFGMLGYAVISELSRRTAMPRKNRALTGHSAQPITPSQPAELALKRA